MNEYRIKFMNKMVTQSRFIELGRKSCVKGDKRQIREREQIKGLCVLDTAQPN